MTGYIYTLSSDNADMVRYVGQTTNIQKRYGLHLFHSKNGMARTHKEKWINSILAEGLKPALDIVWEGDSTLLDKKETEFIALFKSFGANLTNATLGGTTTRGRKCSEETKQKLSLIQKGRKFPDRKFSAETLAKFRESRKGFKMPESAKKKLSEARKGKPSHWTYSLMPENYKQRLAALNILKAKKIIAIKDGVETIYDTTVAAEAATGCNRKTMRLVARGEYKQCKGYQFKYPIQ